MGAYATKSVAVKAIMYLWFNQDVNPTGTCEVDLKKVPMGQSLTFKWCRQPLFVRHRYVFEYSQRDKTCQCWITCSSICRTDEEIEWVRNVNLSTYRDPEPDEKRVKDPRWLVVLGICTHLGCVPIANKGKLTLKRSFKNCIIPYSTTWNYGVFETMKTHVFYLIVSNFEEDLAVIQYIRKNWYNEENFLKTTPVSGTYLNFRSLQFSSEVTTFAFSVSRNSNTPSVLYLGVRKITT